MRLVNSEEMRKIDQLASLEYKLPSLVLMENAGIQVAQVVKDYLQDKKLGRKVLILAGKGNNGGDGLVAARHLFNAGYEVKVMLLAQHNEVKGDALINLNILRQLSVPILPLCNEKDLNALRIALLSMDLVVDAIYGTGFTGTVPALVGKVIRIVNSAQNQPVIAVDIPSGLEANTGKVHKDAIRATCTVAMALPKIGMVINSGPGYVGDLKVVDISIPLSLLNSQQNLRVLLDRQWCLNQMKRRKPEEHKGSYGHVLILGGSEGLSGAVVLAGEAALRTGAGLVTVGVPGSLNHLMENKLTEVMSYPLPETLEKKLHPDGLLQLDNLFNRASVIAVGPGMSRYPEALEFIKKLLKKTSVPVVIDADGLNALAEDMTILKDAEGRAILTPHPGEMARLLGISVEEIQEDRLKVVKEAAELWKVVVVLKGDRTLVADFSGNVLVNPTGNPGMATGGSGDVLTGIISGLIAQGMSVFAAAGVGVYVHGLAGDWARKEKGMRGLIAGDLIQMLPRIWRDLENELENLV